MPPPKPKSSSSESSASESSASPRPSTSAEGTSDVHHAGFFIPDDSPDEAARDPFTTPNPSVPASPKPASVVSFSGFADRPLNRRYESRISVQSALRQSTTDMEEHATRTHHRSSFMPPRPIRAATTSSQKLSSRLSTMSRTRKPMRSTMLAGTIEKPWLTERDTLATLSHWIVYLVALLGIAGGAIRCYFAWKSTLQLGKLCLVMEDNFDSFDTENTWTHEVSMSGFGNQEFEVMTDSPNNSYVRDGRLYIVPTLTSDTLGLAAVRGDPPFLYNVTGCTDANTTNCGALANATAHTVLPPVMSARIHTRGHYAIRYGRVEISARIPRGDWLWPALWMLPVHDTYGVWPRSGEIDIMEARGNGVEYGAQGVDYVRGALNWGPFAWLNGVSKTYGWWTNRRRTFADGFHTYALEWDARFVRVYVDSRLTYTLLVRFDEPFFARGAFPPVVANGSDYIALTDPWVNGTRNVAPFDEPFYLIMNVAVGGTSGWFPDGVGGKPWLDGSLTAMSDFAYAQEQWAPTWPQNPEDRALVVDSVKMWELC